MYILDTNTVSAILRTESPHLRRRITATPYEQLYISIIVAHEMISDVLGQLNQNERTRHVTRHYEFFRSVIDDVNRFQILPYDDAAETIFQNMPAEVKRVGTRDCRIAASASSRGFTVVTNNVGDFSNIQAACGVRFEDWTARPLS